MKRKILSIALVLMMLIAMTMSLIPTASAAAPPDGITIQIPQPPPANPGEGIDTLYQNDFYVFRIFDLKKYGAATDTNNYYYTLVEPFNLYPYATPTGISNIDPFAEDWNGLLHYLGECIASGTASSIAKFPIDEQAATNILNELAYNLWAFGMNPPSPASPAPNYATRSSVAYGPELLFRLDANSDPLPNGYYLVYGKGTKTNPTGSDPATEKVVSWIMLGTVYQRTTSILYFTDTFERRLKADAPYLHKEIFNHNYSTPGHPEDGWKKWTDIGQNNVAEFKLTSQVPDMSYIQNGNILFYDEYFYTVHDTMSVGLTFNNDVLVYIGGDLYPQPGNYTVTQSGQSFDIEFNKAKFAQLGISALAGAPIEIYFTATLNPQAIINNGGVITDSPPFNNRNWNRVRLEYQNNPYIKQEGKPKDTNTTPPEIVFVYTFDEDIYKYTGDIDAGTDKPVPNVQFKLQWHNPGDTYNPGPDAAHPGDDYKDDYYIDSTGAYFAVFANEGTNAAGKAQYRAVSYKKAVLAGVDVTSPTAPFTIIVTVPASGKIYLVGIDAAEYDIIEVSTPAPFNQLEKPVSDKVTHDSYENSTGAPNNMGVRSVWVKVDGVYVHARDPVNPTTPTDFKEVDILNNVGVRFPETGGMGRTIFIVVGSLLMLGAIVAVIVRRKIADRQPR